VHISAAIIGPGLPALKDTTIVPSDILAYAEEKGFGVSLFKLPEDKSTCNILASDAERRESDVVDSRCHFYDPFGRSNSWVVLDEADVVDEVSAGAVFVEKVETRRLLLRRFTPHLHTVASSILPLTLILP